MKYSALIIDVKSSKDLDSDKRELLQKKLILCKDALNDLFEASLEKKVMFSGGDELQGLFSKAAAAIDYFLILKKMMTPFELRAGIGVGEWALQIEDDYSTVQDGPVYHLARKAIKETDNSNTDILLYSEELSIDMTVNMYFKLLYEISKKQSTKQKETALVYCLISPMLTDLAHPNYKEKNKVGFQKWLKQVKTLNLANDNWKKIDTDFTTNLGSKISKVNNKTRKDYLDQIEVKETGAVSIRISTTTLARILGEKRQNLQKLIDAGNIERQREVEWVVSSFVAKYIDEKR